MSAVRPPNVGPGRSTLVMAGLAGLAAVAFLAGPVGWAAGNVREGFPGYFTAARLVAKSRRSPAKLMLISMSSGRLRSIMASSPTDANKGGNCEHRSSDRPFSHRQQGLESR